MSNYAKNGSNDSVYPRPRAQIAIPLAPPEKLKKKECLNKNKPRHRFTAEFYQTLKKELIIIILTPS
jgi:hypothetical protein